MFSAGIQKNKPVFKIICYNIFTFQKNKWYPNKL